MVDVEEARRELARRELERRRGATQQPVQEIAQPQQDTFERATLLPFGKDSATGEVSVAVPGILKGAWESARDAFTAPGRAMSGELQVMGPDGNATQEAIGEGLNFAQWASPASVASSMKMVPAKGITAKPEGLVAAEAAQRLGIDLPRAVTSESTAIHQSAKGLSNVPFASTPLRKASEAAIGQLDDAARGAQQAFGSGSVARAGSMAREDITNFATKTLKDAVTSKYNAVDDLITQNVVLPLTATQKIANNIAAKRTNMKASSPSRAVRLVQNALNDPQGLNYQGVKDLRTSIGELLDDPMRLSASGMDGSELKQIYGGLSDDLRNIVSRAGGDKAASAFDKANTFASKVAVEREALDRILGRQTSDEGLFSKIQAMAGSNSRADMQNLLRAKNATSKETWDEIASAVLSDMGRDVKTGNFSPDRFLTSYGKMSQNGKMALFGNADHARALDDIAAISRRFNYMNQYANPSGTAQNVLGPALAVSALSAPVSTISSLVGGRVTSSILAKPLPAEKLAKWARAYEEAALKPSVKTSSLLQARAKVLSLELADQLGAPNAAGKIFDAIARVGQVPADDDPQNQGAIQENQGNSPDRQPRMLMPNEL